MNEVLIPIIFQICVGGILGFFSGYAIRKITKIVAVLICLGALFLIYLGYTGTISINYNELARMFENLIGPVSQVSFFLTTVIAHLPFAWSFITGVAIGNKLVRSIWKFALAIPFIMIGLIFSYNVIYFFTKLDVWNEWLLTFMSRTLPAELIGWGIGTCLIASWLMDNKKEKRALSVFMIPHI
jgi:uncharacterized membrane protein (Fun14 family)